MAKKLMSAVVVVVVLLTVFAQVASADDGSDLVGTLLKVKAGLRWAARAAYTVDAKTCNADFIAFTQGEKKLNELGENCTTDLDKKIVAQVLCANNVKRGKLVAPRGWTQNEFVTFCTWAGQ